MSDVKSSAREKLDQAFCDLRQGSTLPSPGSQVSSGGSSLPKTFYSIRALLVVVLIDQEVCLDFSIKWYGKMRTNFLANPIITASEIAPFFSFFFCSRYCMEFKTESLTHHCAMENRPLTRWMQYLREGYTVCVDCQPPAMNSVSLRCSGDGLDSDG